MVANTFTPGFLSMGKDIFKVSLEHVFAANRKKLLAEIRPTCPNGVIFLKGGSNPERNDTDHEPLFRQESYFWWLTGVKEPDCAIALEITTGKATLFIPFLDADYATIMGPIKTPEQWKESYQIDEMLYLDDIETALEKMLIQEAPTISGNGQSNGHSVAAESKLLLMRGLNTDSGNMYEPPSQIVQADNKVIQSKLDTDILFSILCECRVIKSEAELAIMRHISEVTSFGHAYVMRNIKAGNMEYQGESLFLHYCYYNYGCRYQSYTPICGCGPNASVSLSRAPVRVFNYISFLL
jgi:Xaa-Pro dipeptidase